MNFHDCIIIGGGPSGLMAAWSAAKKGGTVLLLEKNQFTGRKLVIAGSGQCNLTHEGTTESFLTRYGSKGRFVKPALYRFTPGDLIEFFTTRGLPLVTSESGKLFPETKRGNDVLQVLLGACSAAGADVQCGAPVRAVTREGGIFVVTTLHDEFRSRSCIIATGGKSYPATGSRGDGYEIARALGHGIVKPVSALAPVYIENHIYSDCSGISLEDVTIHVTREGVTAARGKGDVLVTHEGLSGPGILDLSRSIEANDVLVLNLLPAISSHELQGLLREILNRNGKKYAVNALAELPLPGRLIESLIVQAGITPQMKSSQVHGTMVRELARMLSGLPLKVKAKGDFSVAMATAGGVDTQEVYAKSLESKIVPGLCFAGEVLDVDGDTGGFNLQFAFSSGFLAGETAMMPTFG